MRRFFNESIFGIIILSIVFAFTVDPATPTRSKSKQALYPFAKQQFPWADSVFNSLSLDERIGQLFMVAAFSNRDQRHMAEISNYILNNKIGGLIFFQGGPVRQAIQTNYYQSVSKTPLLIGIDGEWGLGMRLDSTISFPRQMMLGAIKDEGHIYEMGEEIARECKRMGIHINFAPVVDINSNPRNPVISNRSFGENREDVTVRSIAYMMGMQNNHILSVAKHFPGHGDTEADSHIGLPVVDYSYTHLDSIELYPFRELINCNIGGIMVAHLSIPALDSSRNTPSSVSKKIVTSLLRDSLHFNGIVFTDALNMRAVSANIKGGELEVRALEAGADVLVMPNDVTLAVSKIKEAIVNGRLTEERINASCRKILQLKEWVGLNKKPVIELKNLTNDLNAPRAEVLNRRMVEEAITVVRNKEGLLPLTNLASRRIASVSIGETDETSFTRSLSLYMGIDKYYLGRKADSVAVNKLLRNLRYYNLAIVSVSNTTINPQRNYGVSLPAMTFLDRVADSTRVILDVFTPPYFLDKLNNLEKFKAILVSYEDSPEAMDYSAQLIFGGISARGILPVTAAPNVNYKQGLNTQGGIRFKYTLPEDVGISSQKLQKADSIVNDAIQRGAMPGCQVLAARNGVVFYHKAFGFLTYDNTQPVKLTDLYDLASVTKIAATLPAVMKLYETGSIKLKHTLGDYLPELQKTNKADLVLLDVLTHQARLQPYRPFNMDLVAPDNPSEKLISETNVGNYTIKLGPRTYMNSRFHYKPGYFASSASFSFGNQVADSLFALTSLEDTIFQKIAESPLLSKKEYKYSDWGLMYMYKIVQNQSGLPLQEYTWRNFYSRLGAATTGFWPLLRFEKSQIAPTENDVSFRKQVLRGYVHDPTASLMGGVSGHAGLFSNANDLAKLMQMYLNGGTYGGERYFGQETVDYFTSCPFCSTGNRRGIGFDKPEPSPQKASPVCDCVSLRSFGHSGFTGTFVWADPETGLLYVFLSNRVYPDSENNKLTELNVRTKLMEVFAKEIENSSKK